MNGQVICDPQPTNKRGSFHGHYSLPQSQRIAKTPPRYRLLDCLLAVAASDDPEYMQPAGNGEFAVVDVITKEKAWFDMPPDCVPEMVTEMIEGCFLCSAYRVGNKLWFV